MAEFKTNVMRMLDKEKVPYTPHTYDHGDGAIDGASVAAKMGQDPARVFKTLVTQGAGKSYFVFVVPVLAELDLSKVPEANAAVAEARDRVLACSATLPAGQKEIVSIACVTAESVMLWNEIGAWIAGPRQENPDLAARLEHWYALYLTQWRQVSRESGLPNLTRLIVRYADLLRNRQYGKV